MLPPHPPFVQKIIKRRIVRRRPRASIGSKREDRPEASTALVRMPRPLKAALKVLERTRTETRASRC